MKLSVILALSFFACTCRSQTGAGIGIYPTGTETGIGFRSGKNSDLMLDARITKAVFTEKKTQSSFITELSGVYRVVKLEKVRFHAGIGFRTEWNLAGKRHKIGAVIPIGVEAFPFPFQNAGLFFEAAPYYAHDLESSYSAGVRTVAGFIFYFPVKKKQSMNNEKI